MLATSIMKNKEACRPQEGQWGTTSRQVRQFLSMERENISSEKGSGTES